MRCGLFVATRMAQTINQIPAVSTERIRWRMWLTFLPFVNTALVPACETSSAPPANSVATARSRAARASAVIGVLHFVNARSSVAYAAAGILTHLPDRLERSADYLRGFPAAPFRLLVRGQSFDRYDLPAVD